MYTHHSSALGTLIVKERMKLRCPIKVYCRECGISVKTYYNLLEKKSNTPELCQGDSLPLRHAR